MPLYEYYCKHCNKVFEEIVPPHTPKARCGTCKKLAKKQISAPGGYQMNSGGSSTRPRNAGSFRRSR